MILRQQIDDVHVLTRIFSSVPPSTGLFQSVRSALHPEHAEERCPPRDHGRTSPDLLVLPRHPAAEARQGGEVSSQCHAKRAELEEWRHQADSGAVQESWRALRSAYRTMYVDCYDMFMLYCRMTVYILSAKIYSLHFIT